MPYNVVPGHFVITLQKYPARLFPSQYITNTLPRLQSRLPQNTPAVCGRWLHYFLVPDKVTLFSVKAEVWGIPSSHIFP